MFVLEFEVVHLAEDLEVVTIEVGIVVTRHYACYFGNCFTEV